MMPVFSSNFVLSKFTKTKRAENELKGKWKSKVRRVPPIAVVNEFIKLGWEFSSSTWCRFQASLGSDFWVSIMLGVDSKQPYVPMPRFYIFFCFIHLMLTSSKP